MQRRIFIFFVFLFISQHLWAAGLHLRIKTPYACLMDADTGAVLFEKRAYEEIYPASTTKIATAVHAYNLIGYDPDRLMKCTPEALRYTNERTKKLKNYSLPPHWLEPDGTTFGLKVHEEVSYYDIMHSLLISSSNDSANTLAENAAGDMTTFMEGVNLWAKKIGCLKTNYNNPHGLHHPEHVTCAYDTALMAKEAITYPWFLKIVGMQEFIPIKTFPSNKKFKQSNRLVREDRSYYYAKAFGIKTGSHKVAGKNLVSGASNGQRRLILSLHKSSELTDLYEDAIHIYDMAFSEKKTERVLFRSNDTTFSTVVGDHPERLKGILASDIVWHLYPSENRELEAEILWNDLTLPIAQGDHVGSLFVKTVDGRELFTEPVYAMNALNISASDRVKAFVVEGNNRYYMATLFIALIWIGGYVKRKRRS